MSRALHAGRLSRPKIVLSALGTKGDLFPIVALGGELVRRGYECDLLSNQGYEELACDHGLRFVPVTVPQTNNLVPGKDNLDHHIFPSYPPTIEYFQREIAQGHHLAAVNLDECSAANLMCEMYGLPLCRVVLAPSVFNSVFRPRWPLNEKLRGPMAATYRRYRLPQIYERMEKAPVLLGRINPFRVRLGLPPLDRFSQINFALSKRLGFFPDWFGVPQPDWPGDLELVGFPLPVARGSLEPALEAFIEREGRPLVFTPGTGVVDVDGFFRDAALCCRQLRKPGVFLSPHYHPPVAATGYRIFRASFADLQLLLPKSLLLVHHGGIGTTARALEAGVPQIIRAVAYDQPDNGSRIAELGVGSFLEPGGYDHDRFMSDVERLLSSTEARARLAQLSDDVRRSNAVARAADAIEQMTEERRFALRA